jgi:hypothetical protein
MYTFPDLHQFMQDNLDSGFPVLLRVERRRDSMWTAWLEDADADWPLTVLDRNGEEFMAVVAPTCAQALGALDRMCR